MEWKSTEWKTSIAVLMDTERESCPPKMFTNGSILFAWFIKHLSINFRSLSTECKFVFHISSYTWERFCICVIVGNLSMWNIEEIWSDAWKWLQNRFKFSLQKYAVNRLDYFNIFSLLYERMHDTYKPSFFFLISFQMSNRFKAEHFAFSIFLCFWNGRTAFSHIPPRSVYFPCFL